MATASRVGLYLIVALISYGECRIVERRMVDWMAQYPTPLEPLIVTTEPPYVPKPDSVRRVWCQEMPFVKTWCHERLPE